MKRLLSALNRLLHPPGWIQALLPPAAFAALAYVFLTGQNDSIPACLIYAASAYSLVIWLLPLPGLIQSAKAAVMRRLTGTAFGGRYAADPAFRGSVSLYQGMISSAFYAAFRVVVGVRYASVWFMSMAAYYLVLGMMRLSLILSSRRQNAAAELRSYRRTARQLFLLNIPMGAMIALMVLTDSGYSYPGYVIYVSAMYTFYTVIVSIVNLVRFRRLGSPLLSAAKALNFVAALMSLLGLQTAMISRFSTNGAHYRRMMNAITGGSVWLAVIFTAAYMLHRSRKMGEMKEGTRLEPLGE